jgi:hypothetical protein
MGNWPASPSNGDTTTNELGTQFQYSSSRGAWMITYQTVGNPSYGECYVSTPASTTLTTQSTYYLLQGTTTEGSYLLDFTHASPGRLKYTGTTTKKFLVSGTLGVQVPAALETYTARLVKNGATIVASTIGIQFSTSGQRLGFVTQTIIELATNDYIEIYVACISRASTSIQANFGNLIAHSV